MAGIGEGVLRRIYLRITSICVCLSVTLFLCAGARTMGPMKDQRAGWRTDPSFRFCRHLPQCRHVSNFAENAVFARETRRFEAWKPHRSFIPPSLPPSFLPLIMAFAPRAIILSGADMTAPPQTNERSKEGREKVREPKRKGPSLARLVLSLSLLLSFPRSILPTLAAFCLKFHAILKAD